MKIVNEKGKLFGIINIIDLAVLLVVLLVAVVAGSKFVGKKIGPIAPTDNTKEIMVTAKFTARNEEIINSLKKDDQLISLTNTVNAYLDSISYKDYEAQVQTDDGRILYAKDPKRKEVTVVFKMKSAVGNSTIRLGTQDVAVGKQFVLKTSKAEFNSIIENIEIK